MSVMPDDYDEYDDEECAQCGGEGFFYSCADEGACAEPDSGCDYCMYRCDWCNPRKRPTAAPQPCTPSSGITEGEVKDMGNDG